MEKTKFRSPGRSLKEPLEAFLGYHLRRLSVLTMTDLSSSLGQFQLSPADASVLLTIRANRGITQSDVGRILGILRPNMAPLIGALVKRGLVSRTPVDGRSQALGLSAAGHSLCQRIEVTIRRHEDQMFGALSAAERRKIISVLRRLWRPH